MLQLQGLVMNPSETGNFISPKKITNSGFRIKFLWVARRCHVHSFGFWFTKGYLKDLWGHSLGAFFAIGRNAIQEAQLYSKPLAELPHWCTPCRLYLVKYVRLRQIRAFVLSIYYYFPIIHIILNKKTNTYNVIALCLYIYMSDQFVRGQTSLLIIIYAQLPIDIIIHMTVLLI